MKKYFFAILALGLVCVSAGYALKAVTNTAEATKVLGITQADNLSAVAAIMDDDDETTSNYITIDGDNGTFYRYSSGYVTSTSNNYKAKWESTSTDPLVTLITSNGTTNNISDPNFSSSSFDATAGVVLYTGTSSATYYINISEGYEISGYSFDYYDYSSISPTMTIDDDSYTVPTESESVSKTLDESTSQLTITLTGSQGYVVFHNFNVYYTQAAIDPTGKKIASIGDAVSSTDEFDPYTWYLFQVAGSSRKGYIQLKDGDYYNAGGGDATLTFAADVPSLLFHVIDNGDGTFSFQDSEGTYIALDDGWDVYPAEEGDEFTTFYIGEIEGDVFYVQESTASSILDTNAPNSDIVGWNTVIPTSTTGNNAHQFFPVTLTDDYEEISVPEGYYVSAGDPVEELEEGKWYFLNNAPNNSDRTGWIYDEDGSGYYNASSAPADNSKSTSVANYLFRIASTSDGSYALIDGNNHFMGVSIGNSVDLFEAVVPAPGWTIEQIDAESDAAAFSLLATGSSYYLDTNGPGSTTAVWAGTPTVDGNECVYFVEAEFVELVDEASMQISTLTGTLTGTSTNYRYLWTSEDTNPQVTMTAYSGGTTTVANNMYKEAYDDEGTIIYYSGKTTAGSDYVLEVSEGYVITGYSFTYSGAYDEYEVITIGDATYTVTTTEQESGTVEVTPAQTLTINITGSNTATYLADFYIYIEAAEDVTLTYNIYLDSTDGDLIDTQTYDTYIYYDYPTIEDGDYYTISEQPTGTIGPDDETTISLVATGSYPIVPTEEENLSTTSEDATWYILYDRASTSYLIANNGDGGFASRAGLDDYDSLGDYLFAFVPVGYCQFKVYNASAGYLVQGTSDGDYTTSTTDADEATTFTLGYNTNSSNDGTGFYLKVNDSSAYLNDYSGAGTLGVWASSWATSDAGSLIYAIEMTDEEGFEFVFGDELLDFYTTYGTAATTYLGKNYVGQARNLTETMLAACAAYSAGTVSGMYDAFAEGEIDIDLDIIEFSTDQLYRIRNYQCLLSEGTTANAGNGGYLTYSSDYTSSDMLQCYDTELDDPKTVWQFIASDDDSYDGYYIYLPNVEMYIGTTSSSSNSVQIEMVSDQSDAGIYNLNSQASLFQFNIGCLNSGSSSYSTYIRANGSSSTPVINYGSANTNSWLCWYLEEATELTSTLNVADEQSYATLYLPFAVEVEGTAYVMSEDEDSETTLTATSIGTTVPAATPVLVVNEEAATDVTYEILSEGADEISETNVLSGTYVDLTVDSTEGIYVFGYSDTYGLGFFTPNTTTLAANKAYYQTSGDASAIKINFGDNVETSISLSELTDANETDGIYYDLSGRIVKKPAAGVYIVNGKKVILK